MQAVCSFQQKQLLLGPTVPTVLFCHGLAGLENLCDDGALLKCAAAPTLRQTQ